MNEEQDKWGSLKLLDYVIKTLNKCDIRRVILLDLQEIFRVVTAFVGTDFVVLSQ